jgi:plastocyanin
MSIIRRSCWLAVIAITAPFVRAQEKPEKEEESKVVKVEVTPAEAKGAVGDKIKFTAVGKDATGNVLPDKVSMWFAAPFDTAGADKDGVVTIFQPGEVIVGAKVGAKIGRARITVENPHVKTIELIGPVNPLVVGSTYRLAALPRNANGDPRSDVALSWASENSSVATVDPAGLVRAAKPGSTKIRASGDGANGETVLTVIRNSVATLDLDPATSKVRTGDVVRFHVQAKSKQGAMKAQIAWAVEGSGAQIWPEGTFVAESPGTYTVVASVGSRTAVASVVVTPREVTREVEVVSHLMPKDEQFAEEWIWDHYAYLSSINDKVYVYDIADPTHPKEGDPLKVDARLVNDVSVTPNGKIGVITREGASSRKNGIVFLDTSDAMHPKVLSEYTATVTGGVHSAFINSHYVYLTDDATGSLRVIDFADVKNPKEVARWQVEGSGHMEIPMLEGVMSAGRYLHDVQVVDGLAYLAYWRDGLVILDVGNGVKGGSPEHPQFVSQWRFNFNELYGRGWLSGTHAVYGYKNYVFLGDEVFPARFDIASRARIPVRGIAHVIDVSDLPHPREVATYSVPEAGAHNIWVFDDKMYMGYYNGGGRVVDVSGELRGELYNQGREIARIATGDKDGFRPNLPFAWGAYPYKDLIYVNDVHSGIWIVKLGRPKPYTSTTETPN